MNQFKVSQKRHIAKTISYRIISTLIGFLIMWWITGSIEFGAAFSFVELIYKPIQYYIHERVWYRWIKYGLIEVKPIKKVNNTPTRKLNKLIEEELFNKEKRVIPNVSPEYRVKLSEGVEPDKVIETNPILLIESVLGQKSTPPPPSQEPRVIKEGEQPIKRLTYTKKSD
jgi:uncharacterized membrane protein